MNQIVYQPAKRWLATLLQVLAITALWFCADRAASALGLPFSGGVVGLLVLVTLLLSGALRPALVTRGADWLLGHMLLFFVPLVVSVVQFTSVLRNEGLRLFAAIGLGFICVLLATAFTVEWVCRMQRGRRLRKLKQTRGVRVPAAAVCPGV